jgi:carboxypeptidase C (cathepsin A)
MPKIKKIILFSVMALCVICAGAEKPTQKPNPPQDNPQQDKINVTYHSIELQGNKIEYNAVTGFLPIMDESNVIEGYMFFTAYLQRSAQSQTRPIVFAFNGGPGSSSVWLHVGCLGPKRVMIEHDANTSDYALIENKYSWLDIADMVFIDPIGTGFSYVLDPNKESSFFEIRKDVSSVASFIRLFLTRYKKWDSPKYLVGESYGTLRAVGLMEYLPKEYGVRVDGAVLISSVLNFQTISFTSGNDLPYSLYLPSYTTAAWYHRKLGKDMLGDLQGAIEESQRWASDEYLLLLAKGDNLSDNERGELLKRLQRYTGLSEQYIKNNNYRIEVYGFVTELLKNQGLQLGLMDSRVTGLAVPPETNYYDDPSFAILKTVYVTALNQYLASDLNFESSKPYKSLSAKVNRAWQWGSAENGFVDLTDDLVRAIIRNRKVKIFAAMGCYDLTTPFRTQEYTMDHLGLNKDERKSIRYYHYFSGHQIYTDEETLRKFKSDIAAFFNEQQN